MTAETLWGIDLVLRTMVLIGVAFTLDAGLRAARPQVRYNLWRVTLCGVLALPVLAVVLPAWHVPVLSRVNDAVAGSAVDDAVDRGAPAGRHVIMQGDATTSWAASPPAEAAAEPHLPPSWHVAAAMVWGFGAAWVVLRVIVALVRLRRLRRDAAVPAPPGLSALVGELGAALALRRPVRLLLGSPTTPPMSWGWWRPIVVLPSTATEWSTARQRVVLLHELTHIRRRDWPMHMVGQCAGLVHWFNPLVWWAIRRLQHERELACDHDVLASGLRPSEYAHHLLEVAVDLESVQPQRALALAMAQPSQLEERLMSILSPVPNARRSWLSRAMVSSCSVLAIIGVSSIDPWTQAEAAVRVDDAQVDVPAQTIVTRTRRPRDNDRVMVSERDTDFVFDSQVGDHRVELRAVGVVDFEDDTCRIAAMNSDAYVLARTTTGPELRQMRVTSDRGHLQYTWFVDGVRAPIDDTAEAWFDALIEVCTAERRKGAVYQEVGVLHNRIGAANSEVGALQGRIGELEGQAGVIQGQIAEVTGKAAALRGEMSRIRGESARLKVLIASAEQDSARLIERKIEHELAKKPDRHQIRELELQIANSDEQAMALRDKLLALQAADRIAEIQDLIVEVEERERLIVRQQRLEDLQMQDRVQALRGQIAELQAGRVISELHGQIQAVGADERVREIEQRVAPHRKALRELSE